MKLERLERSITLRLVRRDRGTASFKNAARICTPKKMSECKVMFIMILPAIAFRTSSSILFPTYMLRMQ